MTGSPAMHVAYLATWTVLSVAHIGLLKGLVLNLSASFLFLSRPVLLINIYTQLHTEISTPRQLSGAQTELIKKDGCSSTAIGGACCSIASTVKGPCSNGSTNLPLSSTCAKSSCSNESIKLPSTVLPSTCCTK